MMCQGYEFYSINVTLRGTSIWIPVGIYDTSLAGLGSSLVTAAALRVAWVPKREAL